MADEEKLVIKKTYDQYISQDHIYGTESSTNLNPVREVSFEQIEIIKQRLQIVTDNLIRKRLSIPEDRPEKFFTSTGNSLPTDNSLLRRVAKNKVGSSGDSLFPSLDNNELKNSLEFILGGFPVPGLINNLDKPPNLPCKYILKKYDFEKSPSTQPNKKKDNTLGFDLDSDTSNTDKSSESGSDKSPSKGTEDENSLTKCASIELTWLKIILIVLKILKIIQILVDIIIGIIVPIFEIVSLALICWLVPPAAEQLRQRITEMVMAIIIIILTKLLQMTFNLLNLDCLCDQTLDIIQQIRQAMSSFNTVLSVMNIHSITAIGNTVKESLTDPLKNIEEIVNNKKEAYEELKKEYKNFNFKEMWHKSLDQAINGTVNTLAGDPTIGKINKISEASYKLIKNDIIDVVVKMSKKKKAMQATSIPPQNGSNEVDKYIKNFDYVEIEE